MSTNDPFYLDQGCNFTQEEKRDRKYFKSLAIKLIFHCEKSYTLHESAFNLAFLRFESRSLAKFIMDKSDEPVPISMTGFNERPTSMTISADLVWCSPVSKSISTSAAAVP